MTANDYKTAGYRVSQQVSQAEIDRAEGDVKAAYIVKVCPSYNEQSADVKAAVMQLAVILLLQRHAVATRSGGKTKTSPQLSENAEPTQADVENADRLLRAIQTEAGNVSELVDDIAGLYFRTQFLGL